MLLTLCLLFFEFVSSVQRIPAIGGPFSGAVFHFVSFRFQSSVNATTQQEVMQTYLGLKNKCTNPQGRKYINLMVGGYANSEEGKDQNYTQGYTVVFNSIADRDYFVGQPYHTPFDPLHDAFKSYVGPLLDCGSSVNCTQGVFVFDFAAI